MIHITSGGKDKEIGMLEKAAADFAKKQLAPEREANDAYPFGPFFDAVVQKAFELDFFAVMLPEKSNGMGMGVTAFAAVLEGICQEDSSLGGILFTNAAAQQVMLAAGAGVLLEKVTAAQRLADFLIAFPVFNNPLDVRNMARAKPDGNGYRLSGNVEYVVLGGMAGHALIPAQLGSRDGYTFFMVDLADPGIRVSAPVLSLGLRACPAVDMTLDNVAAERVGETDRGPVYFSAMADLMHAAAAAMALGVMKGAFKEAFAFSQKRFQGGQEILKWSELKRIVAEMAIAAQNAEMSVSMACHAADARVPGWEMCTRAAALWVQKSACDATTDGIQVLGGVGYMKDYGQEKRFRDAKQIQALLGMAPMKKIRYIESMVKGCKA
ncbi:MAG: acyl-CoA dehydrogenase family protein [Thermodesulfobacteriota bacterium]